MDADYRYSEEIEKYEKLQKHYETMAFEVVSSIFRALSHKKIIGSGSFQRYVLATSACPLC